MMVVMFPWDALHCRLIALRSFLPSGCRRQHGLSAIVGTVHRHLAENLDALSGPSGSRLATNALDLVSTMLHAEMDIVPGPDEAAGPAGVSVREYIEANLSDPAPVPGFHRGGPFHLHAAPAQRLPRIRHHCRELDPDPAPGWRTP
jgi:hypothetical protein